MNIQIFGRAKCFDTKKAERYFKERRSNISSSEPAEDRHGAAAELESRCARRVGLDELIDPKAPVTT